MSVAPVPHVRRSSKQDAPLPAVEMADHTRPLRSNPKDLRVRPVSPEVVRRMVEERHYLRSMPAASRCCFGVYVGDDLEGAVVFSIGGRNSFRILEAAKPQDVAVLARLYLSERLPKNSESRVLGYVLRYLRRHTSWKSILSYADPAAGHVGTIYQAAGFLYLGETEANSYITLPDGASYHPRTVATRFGSNGVQHLRATGVLARRKYMPPKLRYCHILDPSWAWRLKLKAQPYPKRERPGEGAP